MCLSNKKNYAGTLSQKYLYKTDKCMDRQQEVRAVLVGSRYIWDNYMPLKVRYMYYIPLYTLLYGSFIDIKHVKFT